MSSRINLKRQRNIALCLALAIGTLTGCGQQSEPGEIDLGSPDYITRVTYDTLGGIHPEVKVEHMSAGQVKVVLKFHLDDTLRQDDWKVDIHPSFTPTFHWAPHLTPTDNHIIAQHVFRAPALITASGQKQIVVIPDLDLIGKPGAPQWYMDLNAQSNSMTLGIGESDVPEHVLFTHSKGMKIPPGDFEFAFYVMMSDDSASLADPWRKPLAFFWDKWFKPLAAEGQPIKGDMDAYVKHTYNWAFDSWAKSVWQEFTINGKRVGAPVFIVNVTQSPNYPGEVNEREFRSIWNQAWFSSLRSAQGLYRYAKRNGDSNLLRKANMTKELALSFPQKNGLFPALIGTEMEIVDVNGKKVSRSKGWGKYYFGNSNRNPLKSWGSAAEAPYHILDMSWTAYLMLTWHTELESDKRLVQYATRYAERLLTLQDSSGFFPAWLDVKTEKTLPYLTHSPETSMSATFLLALYNITKDKKYLQAATRAVDAVTTEVVPIGQWEDFETYWSCSRVLDSLVGKKIERNNAFKQNTLSMYWTAEALLNLYEVTQEKKYLQTGQRVLDELLMYQATWQPSFIPIRALGGFGVMNGDGEWNDSRQSLFAELIIRYGKTLQKEEYIQRGIAALKSSFVMMYCPENPETRAQWEKVYPFFNEKDYGFMMENYGHGGETNTEGLGIGEFTIYDWGNGAAAEAYNRAVDHFGKPFLVN